MAKSEAIFQLVKSLNKNEKRFFTLQSSIGGKNQNYLKVFDVMDKAKSYDAESFIKKLRVKNINISHERNYMEKMILRSLRYYYSDQGVFAQLTEILRTIELLHKKRLNDTNLTQIQKGKALAEKYEYYLLHMELLDWENRVNARSANYKSIKNEVSGTKEKSIRYRLMTDYFDWQDVYALAQKITLINQTKGTSFSRKDKDSIMEIISSSEKYLEKCKHSFRITEICLTNLYFAHSILSDFKKSLDYCKKNVALFHKFPHFMKELPFKYYVSTASLVNRYINLKQYELAMKHTNWLRDFILNGKGKITSFEISSAAKYFVSVFALRIYALEGNFEKGIPEAKEYERMLKADTNLVHPNLKVAYKIFSARIYFGNSDFQKTLRILNEIINYKQSELPEDFVQYAYLLRLITHYEMGNIDVLDSLMQSVTRLFREKWPDNNCGKIICAHIRQLLNPKSKQHKKNIFSSLAKEIKAEEKKNEEKQDYIDFVRWAESK